MSKLPDVGGESPDDNTAYEEYIGKGEAHHLPPAIKKMKYSMSSAPPPLAPEEDPKSLDVFASSQPSESSNGEDGSDYETCKETFDEVESKEEGAETEKLADLDLMETIMRSMYGKDDEKDQEDVVMDSQVDSDVSMEIDENSDQSSTHERPENPMSKEKSPEIQSSATRSPTPESDDEDGDVLKEMNLDFDTKPGSQDVFEDSDSDDGPKYEDFKPKIAHWNPIDENLELEEDEEILENMKIDTKKDGKMKKEEQENEIEKGIEDFQIDSLEKKSVASALIETKLESSTRKRTANDPIDEKQPKEEEMDQSDSSEPSSKQFHLTTEEIAQLESPIIPKQISSSVLEYRKQMDQLLSEFYEKNLVFQPDFKNCLEYKHHRYCEVPGVEPHDMRTLVQKYIEKCAHSPRRLNQPWATNDCHGHRNLRYDHQKCWLRQYLKDHEYGQSSFQLFSGLIMDIMGIQKYHHFQALWEYYLYAENRWSREEVLEQFANVVRLALTAEELLPKRIHLLTGGVSSATFSHRQCAAIVARMFFTRGQSDRIDHPDEYYPSFIDILASKDPVSVEKLKFIFTYTEKMSSEDVPEGIVSFRRIFWKEEDLCKRMSERKSYPLPEVRIVDDLVIEETALSTQIDFANKYLGGGVLGRGAVQEEIRFLMCPELMISQWIMPRAMLKNEAFSIVGAMVFSSYSGYADSLKWEPLDERNAHQNQGVLRDEYGRLRVETLAIDAKEYRSTSLRVVIQDQLETLSLKRELMKATGAFMGQSSEFRNIPIVTGWWGCGAFRGNKPLKFLIQVLAAGFAQRRLDFCPFGEQEMAERCRRIMELLHQKNKTLGELFGLIRAANRPNEMLYEMHIFDDIEKKLLNE